MKHSYKNFRILVCALLLALGGCAAAPMRDAQYTSSSDSSHALVTFVRESIFVGDGIHCYLWDGETFIGTLSAGTLVQYKAAPGPHVFMGNAENWSYVNANLEAGKHYVIKANMFPGFTMRVALTPVESTDERIDSWRTKLKVKEAIPEKTDQYVQRALPNVRTALQSFNDGNVKSAEMTAQHAR